MRDQAARSAAETLRQLAKDAPQRSLWEKIAEAFRAFIDFLRSTVIQWITTILDVISVIASFIFPPLGEAIGLLSGAIDLASAVLGGDPAEIGLAAGGPALDRRRLEVPGHIKSTGAYPVRIKLHPEVTASFNLNVVAA
ncbi:50S ribosomal L9 C-terminal domain-containing protein [Micromonospora azadirachtae]|uniref:50S ribosomal L9 C-terminal domain-containing protein n=1 Tax=Micromonospora azadirachtae TaxID=1970735 RepID=A0ABW3ABM3_9ACTN